jgi:hypothetical protein
MGTGVDELEAAGCGCGTGVSGAFDGPTLFSMAVANVTGDVVCVVGVGAAVETGTMRAVLRIGSDDGLGWDSGVSPWISSCRSSRVCIRPLMTARHRVTSAVSAVRMVKFRCVWYS